MKMIQEEYNVGKSTIYDLKSDKDKILQYAADCESANLNLQRGRDRIVLFISFLILTNVL